MPAVLWFRRDLRLGDLPPLLNAVANTEEVLACFVLDPRLEASSGARRMQFCAIRCASCTTSWMAACW